MARVQSSLPYSPIDFLRQLKLYTFNPVWPFEATQECAGVILVDCSLTPDVEAHHSRLPLLYSGTSELRQIHGPHLFFFVYSQRHIDHPNRLHLFSLSPLRSLFGNPHKLIGAYGPPNPQANPQPSRCVFSPFSPRWSRWLSPPSARLQPTLPARMASSSSTRSSPAPPSQSPQSQYVLPLSPHPPSLPLSNFHSSSTLCSSPSATTPKPTPSAPSKPPSPPPTPRSKPPSTRPPVQPGATRSPTWAPTRSRTTRSST